jgi:hypothetical protein
VPGLFAHVDGGDEEKNSALSHTAVQHALVDAAICGWYRQWRANRLWMPNNNENQKGDNRLFTDSEEQILAD